MKQLVVVGALALLGVFVACGSSKRSSHGGRGGSGSPNGGAAGEGGETPGGADGLGGAAGLGGSGNGGGIGGSGARGGAGAGMGGAAGASAGTGGTAGNAGTSGTAGSGAIVPCGQYDCARLPHVRPGAAVECRGGGCYVPPDGCEEGFAHCSALVSVGCEADLTTAETCGSCSVACFGDLSVCAEGTTGWHCASRCNGLSPDTCGGTCTDFDTDPRRCGSCTNDCTNKNVPDAECVAGQCAVSGLCLAGFGDCDTEFGCETDIMTPSNCGACGRDDCGATNATPDCSAPSACAHPICDTGFGNCDRASADCEATYGASCFPHYEHTRRLATHPNAIAVATDGSYFLGGDFTEDIDFDKTIGVDRHAPLGESDCYLTRFNANGTYAWTLPFGGAGRDNLSLLTLTADGAPVVAGLFNGSVDLDPGPGDEVHDAPDGGAGYVSKLTPTGPLAWARTFPGSISFTGIATEPGGAVYTTGRFTGQVDFNPGAGTSIVDAGFNDNWFLLKLDSAGNFAWVRTVSSLVEWTGVAVASDGGVWSVGTKNLGDATILGTVLDSGTEGTFVAALEPNGNTRLVSIFATYFTDRSPTVVAGSAVHIGSTFSNSIDLDLGAATVTRVAPYTFQSRLVVSLELNGAYRDAHTWPSTAAVGIALAPGGGVLVAVPPSTVEAFYPDGVSAWSLGVGNDVSHLEIASSSAYFIALGSEAGDGDFDFDPGPGVDPVTGPSSFVSRYSF